ncbi:MAG: stage III sporulation protein AD [Clostridiales bacterium]|nr:stage III sporulation protein AD [Clostridiales bacterium]
MIIKILSISLISCILIVLLRKDNPIFALILSIASGLLIFFLILPDLSNVIKNINEIIKEFNFKNYYLDIILKIIAVSYLSEFAIQICQDSGENNIASKISLSSKVIIISMSMPIFKDLLNIINFLF